MATRNGTAGRLNHYQAQALRADNDRLNERVIELYKLTRNMVYLSTTAMFLCLCTGVFVGRYTAKQHAVQTERIEQEMEDAIHYVTTMSIQRAMRYVDSYLEDYTDQAERRESRIDPENGVAKP